MPLPTKHMQLRSSTSSTYYISSNISLQAPNMTRYMRSSCIHEEHDFLIGGLDMTKTQHQIYTQIMQAYRIAGSRHN